MFRELLLLLRPKVSKRRWEASRSDEGHEEREFEVNRLVAWLLS